MSSNLKHEKQEKKNLKYYLTRVIENEHAALLLALLILVLFMTFLSSYFLTQHNIMNVLRQASLQAIVAIGITMIILSG